MIYYKSSNQVHLFKTKKNSSFTIVENELFADGTFSLEVSSPGVDEPLKLKRQYIKNIGRYLEIDTTEGNHLEGKLLMADESAIELEEEKEFPEDESVFTEAEDYALGEIISKLAEESESNNNQKEQDDTDFEWF